MKSHNLRHQIKLLKTRFAVRFGNSERGDDRKKANINSYIHNTYYIIMQTNLIPDECFVLPREIFHLKNSIYHWITDKENMEIVQHNVFFSSFFHKYEKFASGPSLEPLSLDCYANIPHNEFVISLVFIVVVDVCFIPTISILSGAKQQFSTFLIQHFFLFFSFFLSFAFFIYIS